MAGGILNRNGFSKLEKNLKIKKIEIFPVRYPMVMRFKFFEGPVSAAGRPAVIVKITASDGTKGWGESVPIPRWSYETPETVISTYENYLIPILTGKNPFDLAQIHRSMNREIANCFSTGAPMAKAGIDIALYDLIGKQRKVNIAKLWGRKTGDDLLISWTLNPKKISDIEGLIEKGRKYGFNNFNVKVAPDPEFDLKLCKKVKKLAPDTFLWADANGGYSLSQALEIAPKLADTGVDVFEQPIRPNMITGYQQLKKQGALPIIMDEGCVSGVEVAEFIKLKCMDGLAMKPARCGGLGSAKEQLDLIKKNDLIFLGSGLTDPDISLAASLILYSAYGLKYPAALNGPQFLGASVLDTPFKFKKGRLKVPKGPGLGIDVNEEKVKELSRKTWK